ncbi:hypothetical protein CBR_g23678 [Chara braunii]|uniref:N-acetyltransferase domain-containing protein n=1 Tax=Chara braunii TaxID=69332 RepID=A0A388L4W6_CHABU|nr:hypothetical protein CBR_g23678 [Chara braunii]|eukprot:GBG77346.1 hypothetical protein CBR_g23678 [Chara braunii]
MGHQGDYDSGTAELKAELPTILTKYIDSFKKRFAEQEFSALKKRTVTKHGRFLKCACIVAILQSSNSHANLVKSEGAETGNEATDCARTEERVSDDIVNAVKLVVGTLDVSIRQLTPGERIPGSADVHRGGDLRGGTGIGPVGMVPDANGCPLAGLKELYVHVNASNKAARNLYMKIGFQVAGESRVQTGKQSANVPMEKIILMKMHL